MMRNSKILLGAAAAVGILILVIFTAVFFLAGGTASQPDDMFVHDFDGQIADMKIVNGEKEYFAVKAQQGKHDSYYNIYDRQLNPLLETELSFAGEKVGRYLPLGNHKEQWWLLDVETLELHETDLIEPVIHESGEYMAGQRKVKGQISWVVERVKTGELLWEGNQSIVLPKQPWYAIAKAGDEEGIDERDRIINLRTGEVEYTAKDGETIAEGGLGFWKVDYVYSYEYVGTERYYPTTYLLDAGYELAFDGLLFDEVYLNGEYLCGVYSEDAYLKDLEIHKFQPLGRYYPIDFIWTRDGECVFESRAASDMEIRGIRENVVATKNEQGKYEYLTVTDEGITGRQQSGKDHFAYLDGEDGFMRAVKDFSTGFYRLKLSNVPEDTKQSTSFKAENYRWGFLDRNMEPVLPFDYIYASETENGFAVVKNLEGQLAIIDLKMLG